MSDMITRALAVVNGRPYNEGLSRVEAEFAKVHIEGDEAVVRWPTVDGGYDDGPGYLRSDEVRFPAHLLAMSDDEFAAHQAEAQREYDERIRRQMEASQRERENRERVMFEQLMRKYGKPA